MTNQEVPARHTDPEKREILQKAIRKAIANGYQTGAFDDDALASVVIYYSTDSHWYEMIYDHQFAKALWGEEQFTMTMFTNAQATGKTIDDRPEPPATIRLPEWQIRLMQMVVADDPIAYLGAHLDA